MPEPSPNGANDGRDGTGRFAKGNAGGPGNPLAKHVARVRAALAEAVTDDDIREIVRALVTKAKTGDLAAAQELLNRLIGKPMVTLDPEHVDLERKRLNIERRKTDLAEEREDRLAWACVQPLKFDRLISLEGGNGEAVENAGHEKAHAYLKESGAAVLIWGSVLRQGDELVPNLRWTTCDGSAGLNARMRYPATAERIELPNLLWADLAAVIRVLVVRQNAQFAELEGRYAVDRLTPFIDRVRG